MTKNTVPTVPNEAIDLDTPLTQIETGRAVTNLKEAGKRLLYREMVRFTPTEVAKLRSAKQKGITAKMVAEAAGRGL